MGPTRQYSPDLAGGLYLYADRSACGSVARFVVSLTMHVKGDVLEQAVNDVLVLFPHIPVRVSREGEQYVFGKNTARVPVCGESESARRSPGEESAGGYLFTVSFSGKTVYFDIHMSLFDEKGMAAFAKAVVFRYVQLVGFPVENDGSVRALPDGGSHVSTDDPLDMIADIPASRPAWYMDAKAFVRPATAGSDMVHAVQLRIPLSRLRSHAKEFAGSPVTFIAPIVSQSIYEMYGSEMQPGEYVVAAISVNLRQYFPTVSLRPFNTLVSLAYNRRINEYPFNTILMSQKKLLEAQLKTDALAYNAQRKAAAMEDVYCGRTYADKVARAEKAVADKAAKSTYVIHSAGNIGMPESLDRYVTEFYPLYVPGLHDMVLSCITFRNEILLTVAGRDSGRTDLICRRIAGLMNENEIYAYISDGFDFSPTTYRRP